MEHISPKKLAWTSKKTAAMLHIGLNKEFDWMWINMRIFAFLNCFTSAQNTALHFNSESKWRMHSIVQISYHRLQHHYNTQTNIFALRYKSMRWQTHCFLLEQTKKISWQEHYGQHITLTGQHLPQAEDLVTRSQRERHPPFWMQEYQMDIKCSLKFSW